MEEGGADEFDSSGPIAGGGLAEEGDAGIPGGIGAFEHPPPIRVAGDDGPDGKVEGAAEVDDGGIDADDEIEISEVMCGVEEVVEEVGLVGELVFEWEGCELLAPVAFLEGDEVEVIEGEERDESFERARAKVVVCGSGSAGPLDADPRPGVGGAMVRFE